MKLALPIDNSRGFSLNGHHEARPGNREKKETPMSEHVSEVTDANFEQEILECPLPALVDFWAAWCGPCRIIGPIVEEIAEEYKDRARVAKMNVDDNVNTPARYGVRGIPALLLFKNGELVDQIIGAVPKAQVVNLLEKALGS
jgi:thioredoxin 1